VFEASYDAWGKQTIKFNKIGLQRGYTGHEMLNDFDIINMNGRLYDSVLGRFLSPDNLVQMPGNAQRYNRYSYCLNNPLKCTDPSGEAFVIDNTTIAFTLFSVVSSMMQAAATGRNVWKAGAAIGVWFGGGGFLPGAIIGGAIGGIAGSFGGSWIGTGAVDGLYGR
jgi:FG-GAP repeat protein